MKITADNLTEKWSEIKKYMPDWIVEMYADYKDDLKFYGGDKSVTADIDGFLADINEELKEQKVDLSDSKKNDKPKEEKPKSEKKPTTRKKKEVEVDTSSARSDWHRILKKYSGWAGSTKKAYLVAQYIRDIKGSCDSKLGNKTPFVETIQKIHDRLVKLYNSAKKNGEAIVEIPATYLDEVNKCFTKAGVGKSKSLSDSHYDEDTKLSGGDWTSSILAGFGGGKKKRRAKRVTATRRKRATTRKATRKSTKRPRRSAQFRATRLK